MSIPLCKSYTDVAVNPSSTAAVPTISPLLAYIASLLGITQLLYRHQAVIAVMFVTNQPKQAPQSHLGLLVVRIFVYYV